MTVTIAGRLAVLLACALIAGCSDLPRGAALESEIRDSAGKSTPGFAFYPVTRALLPAVETWPAVNAERSRGWIGGGGGSAGQLIAPGDLLDVTIWDSNDNSLLASPGRRTVPLGEMTVSPSGRVFLPYAGEVRVAGMGPDRARAVIQQQLEGISPSAQVQISVASGRQNSVDLVGGVTTPGSYPMPDRNYSVLGLIAEGGGVRPQMRNPRVKLQRGGAVYATSVERLYREPALDTVLAGGDKVIVEDDPRYFLSLGAAGKEDLFYFPKEEVNALEAISLIGGIADTRADPEGILVLREYPREALSAGVRGPRETRVVFSIDMTTADGLFSAQNLAIQPKDVVLATESPVGSIQVALTILAGGLGVARSATLLGN